MMPDSEQPFTIQELTELLDLQLRASGETNDDVARRLRARLAALREGRAAPAFENGVFRSSMEERISALEAEVKRLRELLEGGPKNG